MHDGPEAGRTPAGYRTESLYEAYATRLYVYCWSLVGDDAPEALKDTFAAASRLGPPRGEPLSWLYALARTCCHRRGALDGTFARTPEPDPLRRAAARLRSDHREVLVLSAGEWLDVPGIARLLGLAPDTARQLIQVARARLERAVLDTLMREPMTVRYDDVIAAFEKGGLATLLARRAPGGPPAYLRDEVLSHVAMAGAAANRAPAEEPSATAPLVVIGARPAGKPGHAAPTKSKKVAEAAGLAAVAAAAAGVLAAWPGAHGGSSDGGLTALSPETYGGRFTTSQFATPDQVDATPDSATSAPIGRLPGLAPSPRPGGQAGNGTPMSDQAQVSRPTRQGAVPRPPGVPPESTGPTGPTTPTEPSDPGTPPDTSAPSDPPPTTEPTQPPTDPPTETPPTGEPQPDPPAGETPTPTPSDPSAGS